MYYAIDECGNSVNKNSPRMNIATNHIAKVGEPPDKRLLRILHISDLHFGRPFRQDVANEALTAAIQVDPDVIVVSGDLTQRARRDQFLAAKNYLGQFPSVPMLIVPGNHDVPLYRIHERLLNPHRLYQEIIDRELNPVLRLEPAVIVGLDSTAPRTAISNGRILPWQLQLCERAFADVPDEIAKIVVAHHHFAPAPDYLHDWTMPKAKRAMMRFVELDVDMILGGHLHRAFIGNSLDFYPGSHRDRGIIIVQSGTTTSRRGRGREVEKNSFNVIEIFDERIEITHYLYFDSEQRFITISQHSFRKNVDQGTGLKCIQSQSMSPRLVLGNGST